MELIVGLVVMAGALAAVGVRARLEELRLLSWRGSIEGARERRESSVARAPGLAGAHRLDARAARALVERAIAAAGWQVR